jgi:hypothetical protein
MSFLVPGFLIAATAAAFGITVLHLIVTRRPRSTPFPTARFVPDAPIAARSRTIRFSDLWLLVVRVLAIMLAGAALARPVFTPRRESIVRIIAADVSGSVASVNEVRGSVRAMVRAGDAIVVFDTVAWTVGSADSVVGRAGGGSSGSLSAGLIAALRAGSTVRDGADSVELVMVSPAAAAERDRATAMIRSEWPGRARLVRVTAATDSTVHPEQSAEFLGAGRPASAIARNRIDTAGAVVAGTNVVVAPFQRRWRFVADSLKGARVLARWIDGEPAVIERDSGRTCMKSSLVALDSTGDLTLRPSFVAFRKYVSAPCLHVDSSPDSVLESILAGGNGHLASTSSFPVAAGAGSPIARWLMLLAIVLAIVEMVVRRSAPDRELER